MIPYDDFLRSLKMVIVSRKRVTASDRGIPFDFQAFDSEFRIWIFQACDSPLIIALHHLNRKIESTKLSFRGVTLASLLPSPFPASNEIKLIGSVSQVTIEKHLSLSLRTIFSKLAVFWETNFVIPFIQKRKEDNNILSQYLYFLIIFNNFLQIPSKRLSLKDSLLKHCLGESSLKWLKTFRKSQLLKR